MLKIEYSNHALTRLKIRNIEKSEVEQALSSPQKTYFDIATGYLVAIAERKFRKNHWLIVVYTKLDDIYRVITVIDTKSLNKIIQRRILSG